MGKIWEEIFFLHVFSQKYGIDHFFVIFSQKASKCLFFLLQQGGGSPGKFSFSAIGGVKNCLREGDCVLEGQPRGIPPPLPPPYAHLCYQCIFSTFELFPNLGFLLFQMFVLESEREKAYFFTRSSRVTTATASGILRSGTLQERRYGLLLPRCAGRPLAWT